MLCIFYYNKNSEKLQDVSQKVAGKAYVGMERVLTAGESSCQALACTAVRTTSTHTQPSTPQSLIQLLVPTSTAHITLSRVPTSSSPMHASNGLASRWSNPDFLVCFPTRLWDPWGLCAFFGLVPIRVPATCVYHIQIKEWLRNHNFKIESFLFKVQ